MVFKVINAMFPKVGVARLAVVILASLCLHLSVASQSAQRSRTAKAEQQPKQQFSALPNEQVVEVKGKRTTVRELRAAAELQQRHGLAQIQARAGEEQAKFAARRAQLLQKQKATLEAENAKARAQLMQLGRGGGTAQPTRQEIEEEARQLYARSKTASPAENAEIEKRAAELLRQLQMLSQPSKARAKSTARP